MLHELSFNKGPLIYGNILTDEEKLKYKIITILDDFVFVNQNFPNWISQHKKFTHDKNNLFNEKDQNKINEIYSLIVTKKIHEANKISSSLLTNLESTF